MYSHHTVTVAHSRLQATVRTPSRGQIRSAVTARRAIRRPCAAEWPRRSSGRRSATALATSAQTAVMLKASSREIESAT